MASRWVHLAIKAHTTGALDFREASASDSWRLKEALVLKEIEDELFLKSNELAYVWHCNAASANAWDEEGEDFEFHRKEANKTFRAMGMLMLPWYKHWEKTEKSVAQLWKEFKEEEKVPGFKEWRTAKKKWMLDRNEEDKAAAASLNKVWEARRELEKKRRGRRRKNGRR